jgi:hypothetical protein
LAGWIEEMSLRGAGLLTGHANTEKYMEH